MRNRMFAFVSDRFCRVQLKRHVMPYKVYTLYLVLLSKSSILRVLVYLRLVPYVFCTIGISSRDEQIHVVNKDTEQYYLDGHWAGYEQATGMTGVGENG